MKATIDRIEGSLAVLISCESNPVTFNIPISFLGDSHEGDIIDIIITRDTESTTVAKVRVSSLIEKLKQKSGKG
jgi:hypothetical protein